MSVVPLFLTEEEVTTLTGRSHKAKQIEQLRNMGVAFRVNASGRPVVTRSAIEGFPAPNIETKEKWRPAVLGA